MTDLYAFTKPGDPSKSIIVLNVHPSFRLDSLEPTTKEPFAPGALYEFKIDTKGDFVADICYSIQFASSEDGKQCATVRCLRGVRAAGVREGEVIVQQAPVSPGREALMTKDGEYRFFFGWRSDPFFFPLLLLSGLTFSSGCASERPPDIQTSQRESQSGKDRNDN